MKFKKSKFYAINPFKKTIKKKEFNRAMDASWEGKSNKLENTYVGVKGDRAKSLMKKFKFKIV